MESIFRGIFDSELTQTIAPASFMLCLGCALGLGLILALCYMFKARYTASFVCTLALLPAVVCVVIMLVNGNIGTGVAIAGAFSLVRFRSVPGTAREICAIFLAMAVGLITGMGYLAFALLFTLILGGAFLGYTLLGLGALKNAQAERVLTVTVPEDLNYTDIFRDIFEDFTSACQLVKVKTTNMGSLYRLTYHLRLKSHRSEKEMLDAIRCRNGNLEVALCLQETGLPEL